jgi:hypothetical protein
MKKNLNSCADESATEKTIKPASDELNMSAGAEILKKIKNKLGL